MGGLPNLGSQFTSDSYLRIAVYTNVYVLIFFSSIKFFVTILGNIFVEATSKRGITISLVSKTKEVHVGDDELRDNPSPE